MRCVCRFLMVFTLFNVWTAFALTRALADDADPIKAFPKLSVERDWPWWRGPSRKGMAFGPSVPTTFSDAGGYLWKTPVPGRGHSSPVVVGERIFLATADETAQTQAVLAFARHDGAPLWNELISEGGFPAKNHPKNTEATPTIACDGECLYVSFFHHEAIHVTALNLDGRTVWHKNAGHFNPQKYQYGYAPSPVLYRDMVIVLAEYDGDSFLAAFDRRDGREVWRTPQPTNISFSSPVIAHVAGKDQLLFSGGDRISAFNPATGKPLWSAPGTTTATCGTAVWEGDVVFASGGYPGSETVAMRADGSGAVLWRNNQRCYEQSMLVHDGYLYALTGQGIAYCWRTADGHEMWKQRLQGPVSASPVFARGNIYWANELGTMYVIKADPANFELVAENHVGTDSFPSPAICGGQIFLRVGDSSSGTRQELLYCFGESK